MARVLVVGYSFFNRAIFWLDQIFSDCLRRPSSRSLAFTELLERLSRAAISRVSVLGLQRKTGYFGNNSYLASLVSSCLRRVKFRGNDPPSRKAAMGGQVRMVRGLFSYTDNSYNNTRRRTGQFELVELA